MTRGLEVKAPEKSKLVKINTEILVIQPKIPKLLSGKSNGTEITGTRFWKIDKILEIIELTYFSGQSFYEAGLNPSDTYFLLFSLLLSR